MGEGRERGGNKMKHQLTPIAKNLRKNQTDQERKLWYFLKAKRLNNYKFRRQYPIGNYIVDFCCPRNKLVIELDGGQHNEDDNLEKDKDRDDFLKNKGFKILRIWNNEVDKNISGVYDEILKFLK